MRESGKIKTAAPALALPAPPLLRADDAHLEELFVEVERGEPLDRAMQTVGAVYNEAPEAVRLLLRQQVPQYLAAAREGPTSRRHASR